jgi:hypothetical protein
MVLFRNFAFGSLGIWFNLKSEVGGSGSKGFELKGSFGSDLDELLETFWNDFA